MSKNVIPEEIVTNDTINYFKAEKEKLIAENKSLEVTLQSIYKSIVGECEEKVRKVLNFQDFELNVSERSLTFRVFNKEKKDSFGTEVRITKDDRYDFANNKKASYYELSYSATTINLDKPNHYLDYIKLVGEVAEKSSALIEYFNEAHEKYDRVPAKSVYSSNWDKIRHLRELIQKEVNLVVENQYQVLLKQDQIKLKSCLKVNSWQRINLYESFDFEIEVGRSTIRNVSFFEVVKRNKATTVVNIYTVSDSNDSYRKHTETFKNAAYEEIVKRANNWNIFHALNKTIEATERHYREFKYNLDK